ncbi:hypothetical protein ACP4OV_002231 [Aristida adscensionis]
MAGGHRLSDLPDDLLRRVLHFAPAREGASTALLSRRWRELWRTSGAVNVGESSGSPGGRLTCDKSDLFLREAAAALAAASPDGPVRRLAIHVEQEQDYQVYAFLRIRDGDGDGQDMVADLLRRPAARRLEELRVRAGDRHGRNSHHYFELDVAALPSETLRVLHLGDSGGVTRRRRAALPAPGRPAADRLAAVHLEAIGFLGEGEALVDDTQCYRLVFPAATSLVFARCIWEASYRHGLELDAPNLRYFRYKGFLYPGHRLSLKKPQPSSTPGHLIRVDLHLDDSYSLHSHDNVRAPLWQLLKNFSMAKVMKLKLDYLLIDQIAIADDKDQEELLGDRLFHDVERFELEGQYDSKENVAAVAIGNVLYCCPRVCDLRLKLTEESAQELREASLPPLLQTKDKLDFEKSVSQFRLRRIPTMSVGGDYDEDYVVPNNIPGLSEQSFSCLQSYLRRVSLEFRKEKPNCLGVQLAKFFAENAMILEEMYIDDGNHKMWEHMNHKIEKWVINSSRRRNLPTAANFRVLPYETSKKCNIKEVFGV